MIEKNYIIGMSNNEISKKYMEITIPEIKRVTLNDEVILWEGTTPETMPSGPLRFNKTKPTMGTRYSREITPTERAVWYSHFLLWKHISETEYNSWVFEHDIDLSKIEMLIPPVKHELMTASCVGGMECYFITPRCAKILYDYAEKEELHYQVDSFVYDKMLSNHSIKSVSYSPYLPLKQLRQFGTTINHQPSSAT